MEENEVTSLNNTNCTINIHFIPKEVAIRPSDSLSRYSGLINVKFETLILVLNLMHFAYLENCFKRRELSFAIEQVLQFQNHPTLCGCICQFYIVCVPHCIL